MMKWSKATLWQNTGNIAEMEGEIDSVNYGTIGVKLECEKNTGETGMKGKMVE